MGAPQSKSATWFSEVSGRLRSLAGLSTDIVADAKKRAEWQRERAVAKNGGTGSDFEFVALAYFRVQECRGWQFIQADVIYSPTQSDVAHADLVFNDKPPDVQSLATRDQLARVLSSVSADKVDELPLHDSKSDVEPG